MAETFRINHTEKLNKFTANTLRLKIEERQETIPSINTNQLGLTHQGKAEGEGCKINSGPAISSALTSFPLAGWPRWIKWAKGRKSSDFACAGA